MGRYRSASSDEEDRPRKSKKRKKRRSRSSSISSQQSHISDKNKRLRRKQRRSSRSQSRSSRSQRRSSRSQSRSLDRKGSRLSRRSRSHSLDKYGSRKHRSVSRSSDRRGSRRSRSPPSKHGRSPSSRHPRSYSKSRSASRERRRSSRSYSRERAHPHRSSADRHKVTGQIPGSPTLKRVPFHEELCSGESGSGPAQLPSSHRRGQPIPGSVSGLCELTPYEQAEERMRQALKAAAVAGEKLKCYSAQEPADSKNFLTSVSAIESDSFVASSFRSLRSTKVKEEPIDSGPTHDDAIFGSLSISGFILTPDPDIKPIQLDPDSIMHPSLYCDPQEKMDTWIFRLSQLRRRKLEGEAIQ